MKLNAEDLRNLNFAVGMLNAGRSSKSPRPVDVKKNPVRPWTERWRKEVAKPVDLIKEPTRAQLRAGIARGVLEPILGYMKIAGTVGPVRKSMRPRRPGSWRFDSRALKTFLRAEHLSRIPPARRLRWLSSGGQGVPKESAERLLLSGLTLSEAKQFLVTGRPPEAWKVRAPSERSGRMPWVVTLNRFLEQCVAFPQIADWSRSGEAVIRWEPFRYPGAATEFGEMQARKTSGIQVLLYLAQHGLQNRVNCCPRCLRWFHARPNREWCPRKPGESGCKKNAEKSGTPLILTEHQLLSLSKAEKERVVRPSFWPYCWIPRPAHFQLENRQRVPQEGKRSGR